MLQSLRIDRAVERAPAEATIVSLLFAALAVATTALVIYGAYFGLITALILRSLFFSLVSARYERGSILLTSNKSYGEWGQIFGEHTLAAAILDRLLHHSTTINIRGDSYRLKERRKAGLPFTREQRTTIITGILCSVLILVVLQLWLFTATMNAYLGGDEAVIWPAAAASTACFVLNVGLLRYLYRIEKAR